MVIGDPYKFGFLIERVEDWEYPPFINGLMFLYLNKKAYPCELRTTALSSELPELLDDASPLAAPKKNKELFNAGSEERFEYLAAITYPGDIDRESDLSYLVPFHEINDSGFAVFTLTDGESVMITVGQWSEGRLIPKDEYTLLKSSYNGVIDGLKEFYKTLDTKPAENKTPAHKAGKVTLRRIKK